MKKDNISLRPKIDEEDYNDEFWEGQPNENCPKCSRMFDDIDFDFQSCSKCGWNI